MARSVTTIRIYRAKLLGNLRMLFKLKKTIVVRMSSHRTYSITHLGGAVVRIKSRKIRVVIKTVGLADDIVNILMQQIICYFAYRLRTLYIEVIQ